jgi:hypothetical protein
MERIKAKEVLAFFALLTVILGLGLLTYRILFGDLPLDIFRGIALAASIILLIYLYSFIVYRVFLGFFPPAEGEIRAGTREEFLYHVDQLFFLFLFVPLMRMDFLPIPLMTLIYKAMGARIGDNSYTIGMITDPKFVEVGDNSLIGTDALLISRTTVGERAARYSIRIGNNVTVGARAIILPRVVVGDHAVIAANAVVLEGSRIGPGETWGGVPARRLKGPSDG